MYYMFTDPDLCFITQHKILDNIAKYNFYNYSWASDIYILKTLL